MSVRGFSTSIPTVSPKGFVVIDTETTGGHADARIIELGMVFLSTRGTIQETFSTLLYGDGTNGEWYVRRVHRIRQQELIGAPQFRDIVSSFLNSLNGRIVLAHNASFDMSRINHELSLARRKSLQKMACTIEIGKHLGYGRLSLNKAIEQFDLIRQVEHHALYDALAAAQLFQFFLSEHPKEVSEFFRKKNLCD